ncbi:hypothetical protein N0V93_007724 [Gnomoniopsis smithogilvyi]|uniref:F-box domain-containing protein n=1 Tax=Gnomoniopsis smithogilvyi TaxID=1191159 RepID=A0A9W9CT33_9PEZI|nr:hypothetical protein N0V93_007724 [Gnomoniopsis smithogilvyi]
MASSKQSRLVELLQPTQYVPMRDCLFRLLDQRSILRLAQTSKQVREMIYGDKALWNINLKLARFFDNTVAFRSQLALCDALIAGSFALQFFEQVNWSNSDIDLYAKMGDNMEAMDSYLIKKEGYMRAPNTRLEESDYGGYETTNPHGDVIEVRTYFRGEKMDPLKVQLMATNGPPCLAILRNYYMSCICNFITWNKAYSMYPKTTFVYHKTFPLLPLERRWKDLYQTYFIKYRQRGWGRMIKLPIVEEPGEIFSAAAWAASGPLPAIQRKVGDKFSWVMRLEIEGVTPSAIPDSVIESSGFEITAPKQRKRGVWWNCKVQDLCEPAELTNRDIRDFFR